MFSQKKIIYRSLFPLTSAAFLGFSPESLQASSEPDTYELQSTYYANRLTESGVAPTLLSSRLRVAHKQTFCPHAAIDQSMYEYGLALTSMVLSHVDQIRSISADNFADLIGLTNLMILDDFLRITPVKVTRKPLLISRLGLCLDALVDNRAGFANLHFDQSHLYLRSAFILKHIDTISSIGSANTAQETAKRQRILRREWNRLTHCKSRSRMVDLLKAEILIGQDYIPEGMTADTAQAEGIRYLQKAQERTEGSDEDAERSHQSASPSGVQVTRITSYYAKQTIRRLTRSSAHTSQDETDAHVALHPLLVASTEGTSEEFLSTYPTAPAPSLDSAEGSSHILEESYDHETPSHRAISSSPSIESLPSSEAQRPRKRPLLSESSSEVSSDDDSVSSLEPHYKKARPDLTDWSPEEKARFSELSQTNMLYKEISAIINREFHDGQPVRTEMACTHMRSRMGLQLRRNLRWHKTELELLMQYHDQGLKRKEIARLLYEATGIQRTTHAVGHKASLLQKKRRQ